MLKLNKYVNTKDNAIKFHESLGVELARDLSDDWGNITGLGGAEGEIKNILIFAISIDIDLCFFSPLVLNIHNLLFSLISNF